MATIVERRNRDGTVHYKVAVRLKGHPVQYATFERKTDAKRWAVQTEAAIRERRHFKSAEPGRRTFGEMVDRYIAEVLPVRHKKSGRGYTRRYLTWWKSHLGAYTLSDITPSLIVGLRDRLLASPALDFKGRPLLDKAGNLKRTKSPATVVRYMASLSVMYTTAVNEWEWCDQNPVRKVKRPQESRGRVRFLSDEERKRLLAACRQSWQPYLYPIVVLALSTGARQGEILSLTWVQIDWERHIIRLEETKNKERRALPLVGHAFELLEQLHKNRSPHSKRVFPRRDGLAPVAIKKPWNRAMAEAKLADFRFHDLRHSAASYLAMSGATLAEIADVLGHKTLQMVKRYAHLSEQHTTKVVQRMNDRIFDAGDDDEEPPPASKESRRRR